MRRAQGGQYSDFSAHWFATVGTSLVISLLVQVVAPNVAPLCSACCVRRCVRRRRAKRAVTQGELDEAFAPPEYDIGTRGPFFLSVVLLCLVYGGGLPGERTPLCTALCFTGRAAHFPVQCCMQSAWLLRSRTTSSTARYCFA